MATWLVVGGIVLALLFPAMVATCFGGPRDRVAVAEAEAFAQISQRRKLPNDFENKLTPTRVAPRISLAEPIATAAPSQYAVIVFSAEWCAPCRLMAKELGTGNERLSLRYVDYQQPRPDDIDAVHWTTALSYLQGGETLPLTTWVDHDGKIQRTSGKQSISDIVGKIQRNNPPIAVAAAVGRAGAIHARGQIRDAITFIRSHVGENVTIAFRLDRTGSQKFALLEAGTDYSPEAFFGRLGRISVDAPGAKLPVTGVGFGYRFDGDDLTLALDPIRFPGLAKRLGRPETPEAVGVDPGTILTILGVLSSLWQIMHPSCDLEMGGNVSCEAMLVGDTLTVRFSDAPKLRIKALWQWLLGVESVAVSEREVAIEFLPQRAMFPIRRRTFAVEE